MKRFFITLIMALSMLFMFSCKTQENVGEINFGSSITMDYTLEIGNRGIDSICVVDSLPDYREWVGAKFTDYETNETIYKRMCMKRYNDGVEFLYILVGYEEPYIISRRKTQY